MTDQKDDEQKEKVEKELRIDPVCQAGVIEIEKKKEDKDKIDPYRYG